MKQTRKLLAMLLCIAMVLGMATTVFAANDNAHTIKVTDTPDGYEYDAYQIFKGDLVDGQLTNIAWGANVDSAQLENLMEDLNDIDAFAKCKNVVDVATVLGKNTEKDHDTTVAFADVISNYLTGTPNVSKYNEGSKEHIINVTGDGYYLVKNTKVPAGAAFTRYILKVVGDVSVSNKGDVPSVGKNILETTTDEQGNETTSRVDANTADIGDTITYEIVGTLPSNIADYDTYYYVFHDTMSDGLTYTNNVTVTVNGMDVTAYFYKNVTVTEATDKAEATTNIVVGIPDLLALELIADLDPETEGNQTVGNITHETEVILTYTALVNEKANIGVNGETNEVKLQFSNDPNVDGEGAENPPTPPADGNEMPDPQVPTGETPKDIVKTFTTEIEITKKDALTDEPLTGAKFSIAGISSKVKMVNKQMFVAISEVVEGTDTYYRLKDGTYTATAPVYTDDENTTATNEKTSDAYELDDDGVAKMFHLVTVVSTETVEEEFVAEGWVNAQGLITFTGLGEGTYTITELVAPDGYNRLEKPITVVISSNAGSRTINDGTETVTWEATVDNQTATVYNGVVKFDVKNTSGSTLPETGGIGTTLFYVFGGIMVLGAAVLLVTKKRMAA